MLKKERKKYFPVQKLNYCQTDFLFSLKAEQEEIEMQYHLLGGTSPQLEYCYYHQFYSVFQAAYIISFSANMNICWKGWKQSTDVKISPGTCRCLCSMPAPVINLLFLLLLKLCFLNNNKTKLFSYSHLVCVSNVV